MSRIDDLIRTVNQMDDSELLEYVRAIRSERRVRKVKKQTGASRAKAKDQIQALLGGLTPEQRAELIEKLK